MHHYSQSSAPGRPSSSSSIGCFLVALLLLFAWALSACSPPPQASGHKGPVLYVGYLLYQKPIKTNDDVRTTTATITVAALNANDGTRIWQTALLELPAGFGSAADGPYDLHLALDGTILYAVASKEDTSQLAALDARNGHILWKHAEDTDPGYLLLATNGVCYLKVGPGVRNVGPETLKALDGQSGKLLWSVSSGEYRFGQFTVSSKAAYLVQQKFVPTALRPNGEPDVVELRTLRLTDGAELWHKEVENTLNQPSLFYIDIDLQADDQTVYLVKVEDKEENTPTGWTGTRLRTMIALRAQDGSPLWSVSDPQTDPSNLLTGANLILFDQVLYMVAGYHMSVFNAQDGKVLSAFQSSSDYLWLFTPKDHLYALTRATQVCALSSSDGAQRWCSAISVSSIQTPGVVGTENVYLLGYQQSQPQEEAIYVLRQSDGREVSHYALADPKQWGLYGVVFAEDPF